MSAFQVSPSHIGAIVRFALETDAHTSALRWHDRPATRTDATDMMTALAFECYRSVRYRCPDGALPGPCAFPDSPVLCDPTLSTYRTLTPIEAIKACHGLEYQSCEHPEWKDSDAKQLLTEIIGLAVPQLHSYTAASWERDTHDERRARLRRVPGYENAAWTIDDNEEPTPPPAPAATLAPAQYLSVAETAKYLRASLKTAFPSVKFSVRSQSYSGGASIRVNWIDGPTGKEVEHVAGRFSGATFDGMTDCKNYHASDFNGTRVRWGADFVFCNRDHSDTHLLRAAAAVKREWGFELTIDAVNWDAWRLVRVPGAIGWHHRSDAADLIRERAHETRGNGIRVLEVHTRQPISR